MKKMKNYMLSFVDNINIFHSPFNFFINSKATLSSHCGFILSCLNYALLLYLFVDSDMINHVNPKISDQTIANPQPKILLNNKSFAPVLQLYETIQDNHSYYSNFLPIDPSYLSVTSTQIKYTGTTSKETTSFQIHECKAEDFDESLRFEDYYKGKYCILQSNESIILSSQSSFIFGNMTSFSITLSICSNETFNNSCKPMNEILNYLKGKYFMLNFLESSFLLEDYERPERKNYGQYMQSVINKNMMIQTSISFMEVEMELDDAFWFGGEKKIENYIQQDAGHKHIEFVYKTLEDFESDPILVQFSFSASYSKRILKRKYQKLTDLLSLLGGLFSVLQFFGTFIANYFLHRHSLMLFMKKLYKLEDLDRDLSLTGIIDKVKEHQNGTKNLQSFESPRHIYEGINIGDKKDVEIELKKVENISIQKKEGNNESHLSVPEKEKINQKGDVHVRFSEVVKTYSFSQDMISNFKNTGKKKKKKWRFHISILEYMKYSFKSLFSYKYFNEKEKMIEKCEEIYKKELEIFFILKKIREIDKLKDSILEQNQTKNLVKTNLKINEIKELNENMQ